MKMKEVRKVSNKLRTFLIISGLALSLAFCDFTPRLHKDILAAQALVANQEYTTAITRYQEILGRNPTDDIKVKIHYQIGELYSINLNQNNRALDHYEKVKEYSEEPLWLVKAEERIGEI